MLKLPMTTTATTPTLNANKRSQKMQSNQSVSHLLNFTLPPRQTFQPAPRRRRSGAHQQIFNKERFVNAQYRFVMNPTGDYTVHFADPDIFFEWQDILQVIIPRSSAQAAVGEGNLEISQLEGHTICPICLTPPMAPRMTKCGHVYCFPCILHYLHTSDNKWARCPLCFDAITDNQLKSVKWFEPSSTLSTHDAPVPSSSSSFTDTTFETTPTPGSMMCMRLMHRPQITTMALPRSSTWPSDLLPPHQTPFHFLPDVFQYAKFMLATPDYLIYDLSKDFEQLSLERRSLAAIKDDLSIVFVDAAIRKVQNQITKATNLKTPLLEDKIEKARKDLKDIEQSVRRVPPPQSNAPSTPLSPEDIPEDFLRMKSGTQNNNYPAKEATEQSVKPTPNRSGPRQRRNVNPPPPSTSTYYYYQAASGLPIYLHPLDIRILLSHFNVYASFPDTITVKVDASNEGSVNDDLRKRCKYLAHLPEGADVVFIESNLEDVVGSEGLKNFEQALKTRTSKRKEKGRREDRAKARAEEKEKEKRQYEVRFDSWGIPVPTPPQQTIIEEEEEFIPLPSRETRTRPQPSQTQSTTSPPAVRSFASALASAPQSRNNTPNRNRPRNEREMEDEWDIDAAWHELETNSGDRRKRSNKLVLLGGNGRRR